MYSLRKSMPVLLSFFPVGVAYGILMSASGYGGLWSGAASVTVFAGSLQYLMVTFLKEGTDLATVAIMALLLNSRHIFYGIPFIEKWREYGIWRYFLIFALPDESFSLHCSNDFDDPQYKMYTYVFTAALVWAYWVIFSILGSVAGSYIRFDTSGIDFALTALFIVILTEQVLDGKAYLPAGIALVSAVISLLLLGPDRFILPSLTVTVIALCTLKGRTGAVK